MPVSVEGINIPGISTKNAWFINAPGAASVYAKTQAATAEQKRKDEETAKISELGGIIGAGGYAVMNAIANNTDPNTLDPETADYLKNKVGKYAKEKNMTQTQIGKSLNNALSLSAKVDEMVQRVTNQDQGTVDQAIKLAGQYNQFTPVDMPATLGQAPQTSPGVLGNLNKLPPGAVGSQWMPNYPQGGETLPGAASVLTYGVNPPPQKLPISPFGVFQQGGGSPEDWLRTQAEIKGQAQQKYRRPTAPEKPLRQLTQDAEGKWTEVKEGSKTTPKPTKPLAGIDMKRVSDMIANAGDDPTPNDITMIQAAANTIGYDYQKIKVKEAKPGKLWDTEAEYAWRLIPKSKTVNPPSKVGAKKKQIGTKNGKPVYDLGNGKWQIGD